LTERALEFHQKEDSPVKLAEDYGFLAEVYLAEEDWIRANEFARQALELYPILGNHPEVKHTENISRFNFLLAKTQYKLGQLPESIATLKRAKDISFPPPNPQLYLNILTELHELYWQDRQYLEAFRIKQEKQSIEQQYGWRAFIGANSLKPKLFEINTLVASPEVTQETIPLEIIASGREQDVKQLVEKIKRNDYTIIVIHGYSGVGKSSLLNAGLIPILERTAVAEKTFLPVSIRVYTDWIMELGKQLIKALEKKGVDLNRSLETIETILEELKQCEFRNLRVVLIFDQFEEFFFIENTIEKTKVVREEFFKFLGECLKILSIKVILSLRRDYLHYLSEQVELENIDILSRNTLHPIGNFSVENATETIKRLIARSPINLEEDLIQQLVRDLAGNRGEIRPIELQIVGAQLQEEKITTRSQYLETATKEKLIQRYLDSVVQDCGEENQQLANLVLYLLTDTKGTRPLKTREDLEIELNKLLNLDEERLELVLTILLGSGLLVKIQEIPSIRYQLIHDYLAEYIQRKQEPEIQKLRAQLAQERTERRQLETSLQQIKIDIQEAEKKKQRLTQRIRRSSYVLGGLMLVTIGTIITAFVVWQGLKKVEQQTKTEQRTRIEAQATYVREQFESQQLDGLLSAIKAGRDLQSLVNDQTTANYLTKSPIQSLRAVLGQIKERTRLVGHKKTIHTAQFSPNGQLIVTASEDNTAQIWDISGKKMGILTGHIFPIHTAQFNSDGTKIITASEDHTARVWNLAAKELIPLMKHGRIIYSAQFRSDGRYIVTASLDKTARIWDSSSKLLRTLRGHTDRVRNAHFSPDSRRIVTASFDGTARIWDFSGRELATLGTHRYAVNNAEFSPDGKRIVTASDDLTAKIWDISGRELATLKHKAPVNDAQFSPNGQYIVTASDDWTAKIWNLSGEAIATLKGHEFRVTSAQFSPNEKYIVTASDDNTAKIWNLKGELIATLKGHQYPVTSAQFSPDGQYIVTASDDRTAIIWSVHGQNPETFKNLTLEQLLDKGCEWVKDYLTYNPEGKKNQYLCPDLFKQEK
jgi:WD40 repeat protein/tetratricopeptide (TPR) repeat protein